MTRHADACELCGGEHHPLGTGRQGLRLVICHTCGLVRLDPLPSESQLAAYYATEYAAEFGAGDPHDAAFREAKARKALNRMAFLDDVMTAAGFEARTLVELGCAEGEFIGAARRRGLACSALEPDETLAAFVRDRYGIEVACGLFPATRPSTPPGGVDVAVAFHVVEHARSARDFIESLATLLRPGGLLYLCVPDLLMPGCSLDMPVVRACHLYYFTARTLTTMLIACGFEPLRVEASDVCGKPELKAMARKAMTPQPLRPDAQASAEILAGLLRR